MTDLTTDPNILRTLANAIEDVGLAEAFAAKVDPAFDKSLSLTWRSSPASVGAAAFAPLLLQAIADNWPLLVNAALGLQAAPLLVLQATVVSTVQADVAATAAVPTPVEVTPLLLREDASEDLPSEAPLGAKEGPL